MRQTKEEIRAKAREYNKSPRGKMARSAYKKKLPPAVMRSIKKWQECNPEKRRVQGVLNDAVRRGKVEKPEICSKCGAKGVIDGHHADYSKPLQVEWLCRPCHVLEHRRTP